MGLDLELRQKTDRANAFSLLRLLQWSLVAMSESTLLENSFSLCYPSVTFSLKLASPTASGWEPQETRFLVSSDTAIIR